MNRSLKIPKIAHASLAHMVRHSTPKPAIISCTRLSPTEGNFYFAVLKSFEYKIAISANFVQTVKNLNVSRLAAVRKQYLFFNSHLELTELNVFTARKQSLGQGNNFTPVCHSVHREGQGGVRGCRRACMVAWGACVVARWAWVVVGVCMVARGYVWLLGGSCMVGGMHGGGCAWLLGGMHGCRGACMVARWGYVWLGCVCGFRGVCMVASQGGVCMVVGGPCIGYDEIRSMSGRYASYWNAFLLQHFSLCSSAIINNPDIFRTKRHILHGSQEQNFLHCKFTKKHSSRMRTDRAVTRMSSDRVTMRPLHSLAIGKYRQTGT